MVKRIVERKIFDVIILLALLFVISASVYFYVSARSGIRTFEASMAVLQNLVSDSNLLEGIRNVFSHLYSLSILQAVSFLISSIAFLFLIWFIFRLYAIEKMNALVDSLTGLYNRRAVTIAFDKELERAERFNHGLGIAIIDIDYFKQYNDLQGHKAGDKALKKVGRAIESSIRKTDVAGRLGGEEFLVIFPETSLSFAAKICERIRANVEKLIIPFEKNQPNNALTVSIGVSELIEAREKHHMKDVFEHADKQLYLAKIAGRNCVR